MTTLTLDFETRSRADLRRTSVWSYAADPSTDVLCLAVKREAAAALLWLPAKWTHVSASLSDEQLRALVQDADVLEAHNAEFETAVWHHQMSRHGFADIPPGKWRCTAARVASQALPRALSDACTTARISERKDGEGHQLMLKLARPKPDGTWHEDPKDLKRLYAYCLQDVAAEAALAAEALAPWPARELAVWQLDQAINRRGIYCDVDGVQTLRAMLADYEDDLLKEFTQLTSGTITSPKQVAKLIELLTAYGVALPDLTAGTVQAALEKNPGPVPRRLLELRQALAKSSVAKFEAMTRNASADNRIRGALLYHGAATGRWSGKGIQPQNFPRDSYKPAAVETVLTAAKQGWQLVDTLVDEPVAAASRCLRGVLTAAPGNVLYAADFNAIEARVLAWVAGEADVVADFAAGKDPYIAAAAGIYGVPEAKVTKHQRQVGKVTILAAGYNGGWRALRTMARAYALPCPEVTPTDEDRVDYDGETKLSDADARWKCWGAPIIKAWRESRPRTVEFWKALDSASQLAVKYPARSFSFRRVTFGLKRLGKLVYLRVSLPSGRYLYYPEPEVKMHETSWGEERLTLTYMATDSAHQWARTFTYGGCLTENIVQALARDLLADALLRVEAAGYPVVFHVHDEVVSETAEDFGSLEEFEALVSQTPPWAAGCPVAAEGWRGKRYRK